MGKRPRRDCGRLRESAGLARGLSDIKHSRCFDYRS